jgi:predicted DNA-binding WGR domain protein
MPKEVVYLNQEDNHNKIWSYEIIGNDVLVKWGRVGLAGQEDRKTFSSESAQQKFISDKVREKEKKGYKLVTKEKVKQETQTAKELGCQYKIQRIKWAGKFGSKISFISEYDPTKWVYVEIMNSWTKGDPVRLLMSKNENFTLEGDITETSETIKFRDAQLAHGDGVQFAEAVRNHLKRLYEKVATIVAQKFASLGMRKLNLGDGVVNDTTQKQDSTMFDLYNAVGESGASNQVIAQFASLGKRKLDL